MKPQRIALLGTSGAGKTTLGRALAARLDAPFVECDAIRHKANWVSATDDELRAGIDAVLGHHDRWVIDGTFQRQLGDFVSGRADLLVWLDLPLPLKLWRLWWRSYGRVTTRQILWNGNYETWRARPSPSPSRPPRCRQPAAPGQTPHSASNPPLPELAADLTSKCARRMRHG